MTILLNRGERNMRDENRRNLLKSGGAMLAAGVLGGVGVNAMASEHEGRMEGKKGVHAVVVDAGEQGICATCRFWGGIRRVSEDKKTVYCESIGWCNNPDSHNYQAMTTPVTGPMKSWQKWEAL
jgi:anaerobic selenocysteine-containing dehydrogenase